MIENLKREIADAKSNIRFLKLFGKGGTFLDCGANIGEVSRMASEQFDKVIAVEANVVTFRRLLQRTYGIINITHLNNAVYTESGTTMYCSLPKNSTGSTARIKKTRKLKNYYKETISISLDDLCKTYKPRVIKMDIEGCEYEVLQKSKICPSLQYLTVEFHGMRDPKKFKIFESIELKLKREGFKRIHPLQINMRPDVHAAKNRFFVVAWERK